MSDVGEASVPRALRWDIFDQEWYIRRYPEVSEWMDDQNIDDISDFYYEVGQRYGHSPNRYFDEAWYRGVNSDVYKDILSGNVISGFDHYNKSGYLTRSPHWLFDENGYRRRYAALRKHSLDTLGLRNGYDHYLTLGEGLHYSGHRFFNAELAASLLHRCGILSGEHGVFGSYLGLTAPHADSGRVSWYFDPEWYIQRYPDVAREIAGGLYSSALHHYLTNSTPREYDPQEFFSEAHYEATNPDVVPSIEQGHFRNGYDHFLKFGAYEGRSPHPNVDLSAYMGRRHVREAVRTQVVDNPFEHFVASRVSGHDTNVEVTPPNETQTRAAFIREAALILPIVARRPLNFKFIGQPDISIIMVVHDKVALTIQALASLRANYAGAIDLLLVDSGSHDRTVEIEELVHGATITRFRANVGYLDGCNTALKQARAAAVLYLNNDVRFYPGAITNSLARLHSARDIGAVGAKLIRSNMRLQEAGSIVWRDGATYGYRREDDPNISEANFVRDVDYCSAAFLLVRLDLLQTLNGFDTQFKPAYFEDADLCLRIIGLGARIVYDPMVQVEHLEFGSSGTDRSQAMIKTNYRIFARTHQDYLRLQQPAHVRNAVLARERRGGRKRVLYIEDRLPLRGLGSGYVRSNDIIWSMSALGYQVTIFPVFCRDVSFADLCSDFPEDSEIITEFDLSYFYEFILERAGYYDLIWIGRTHNMARLLPIMNECGRYLPIGGAILDTEVIATPRTFERAKVLGLEAPELGFENSLREELECAHYCQQIVAVTSADANLVERAGYHNVSVLGHCIDLNPTPRSFGDRHNILVVGAIHDEGAPNHDGLVWLVRDVLPYLDSMLPSDVLITIAGFIGSDVDMSPFMEHARIRLIGSKRDLTESYDAHRVFVAPTRFAGGLPYKVHEAASNGIPVVTTDLIASQVGWVNGEAIVSAPSNDAEAFATGIVALYNDESLWYRVRDNALALLREDCNPSVFRENLSKILSACLT